MYHHPFWKEIFPNIQPETPMAHSWLVISSQKCPLHWQWTTTGLGPITYTDDGNDGKEHICLGHSWNILPTTKYAYYCVWQDQEEFLTNQISSPILTYAYVKSYFYKIKKKKKWSGCCDTSSCSKCRCDSEHCHGGSPHGTELPPVFIFKYTELFRSSRSLREGIRTCLYKS